MLNGVCVTTPRTVSSTLSQRLWIITGSCTRLTQFCIPLNCGEPIPFQLVKDKIATRTKGTIAKRPKNMAAGTAQTKPGRTVEEPPGCRRFRLSVASAVMACGFLVGEGSCYLRGRACIAETNPEASTRPVKKFSTALWIAVVAVGG